MAAWASFRRALPAALLAGAGFVAVYVVPFLKYPLNPPSIGEAETIGMRTAPYFSMITLSLAAIIGAGMVRTRLRPRFGAWNACIIAGAVYLAAMIIAVGTTSGFAHGFAHPIGGIDHVLAMVAVGPCGRTT